MSQPGNERLYYLDHLRGLLMSLVVLVHAGIIVSTLPVFRGVDYIVTIFMMPLFFMISGFFVALSFEKRGSRAVLADRTLRIALPCVVALLLINPATNYFLYVLYQGPVDLPTFFSYYFGYPSGTPSILNWHLQSWFLIVLFAFVLLTPILVPGMRQLFKHNRPLALGLKYPVVAIFLLGALIVTATVVGRSLHYLLFQRYLQGGNFNFIVQAILWYLPYYAFGIAAFYNRAILNLMQAVSWPHILVGVAVAGLLDWQYDALYSAHGQAVAELLRHLARGFAGFVLCGLALKGFLKYLNTRSTIGTFLAEASYTVFLMHFLFIAVLQGYYSAAGLTGSMMYLVTVVTVYALCLAFHYFVVMRVPLVALLLNGKPMKLATRGPELTPALSSERTSS